MKRVDQGGGPVGAATPRRAKTSKAATRGAARAGDGLAEKTEAAAGTPAHAAGRDGWALEVDPDDFRERLMAWYRTQARDLPWRGSNDPYHIWVSEIMLQQTRVAAVIDHYNEFVRRFPTLV